MGRILQYKERSILFFCPGIIIIINNDDQKEQIEIFYDSFRLSKIFPTWIITETSDNGSFINFN
jgi:hypothetical protein